MWSRFLAAVVLGAALVSSALADSFSANTTISLTNASNQTTDSFFVGNASVITAASFNTNFSRFSDFSTERQGFLYRNNADWNSGTRNNMTAVNNNLTVNASVDDLTSALWHMDGNGTDATSNGNLLAATGTANFTGVAKFGSASLWTSANSNGSVKNSSDVSPPGALFTFEGWFRAISFANPGGACFGGPYLWSRYNGVGQSYILVRIDTTGAFNFVSIATDSMGTVGFAPTASMSLNTWHHIAVTYNGSYLSFWFDGNEQGNLSVSGNMLWDNGDGRNLSLGSCASSTDNAFGGYIDEFRISRVQRYGADGSKTYAVPTAPFGAGATNASWTSPIQDAGTLPFGQQGQRYSTLRYNLTVPGPNASGTLNIRASDNQTQLADDLIPWVVVRSFNSTSNSTCPCSTGSNLSGVSGRYSQIRVNLTPSGDSPLPVVSNIQLVLAAADIGTLRLNSVDYPFTRGNQVTITPASFANGVNTLKMITNNTTFWNVTLTYAPGNATSTVINAHPCYTWKNITVFANVQNVVVPFNKPSVSFTGGWNTSAYLNGTLLTGNRTNNTSFQYSAWEDSSIVYVNISTLKNGSAFNVLADFVCLNATAYDEQTGSGLSTFTVNETGGNSKSTTVGYIWFNGTELLGGGGQATIFSVSSPGFETRFFAGNQPSSGTNLSFALLGSTAGAYIIFTVTDSAGTPIIGATVTGQNQLTGATVCAGITDSSGSVRCFLNPVTTYLFTFAASGFTTFVATIQPTQTLYYIRLGGTNIALNNSLSEFYAAYLPLTDAINRGNGSTITLNATSSVCRLVNMSLNATYRGNTITNTTVAACSGSLSISINLSNATVGQDFVGTSAVVYYYNAAGTLTRWSVTRTLNIYDLSGTGDTNIFNVLAGGSPSLESTMGGKFGANVTALLASLFFTLILARMGILGGAGAGILFLIFVSVFLVAGLVDHSTMAVAVMASIGVALLRRTAW